MHIRILTTKDYPMSYYLLLFSCLSHWKGCCKLLPKLNFINIFKFHQRSLFLYNLLIFDFSLRFIVLLRSDLEVSRLWYSSSMYAVGIWLFSDFSLWLFVPRLGTSLQSGKFWFVWTKIDGLVRVFGVTWTSNLVRPNSQGLTQTVWTVQTVLLSSIS